MVDKSRPTLLSAEAAGDMPTDIDAPDFHNRLFGHYLGRLMQREGLAYPDKVVGLTFKGITAQTLDNLRKPGGKWADLPASPMDLSQGQIDSIYRDEYFAGSKAGEVAAMPGLIERTPELPEQLFDTGVQHGQADAIRFMQQALDETLENSGVRRDGAKSYDGIVGPKTYTALRRAIAEGKLDEVNDRMVGIRFDDMKRGDNYQKAPQLRRGMELRAKSFLTSRRKSAPNVDEKSR